MTVQALEPLTAYPVIAHDVTSDATLDLGTVRTDPHGNGVIGGVIPLPKGATR